MELTIAFFFGLCAGSFLNVVINRLPLRVSVVTNRSRCPLCHKPIAWYDNIPVLSFVLLRARCRLCNAAIPIRYPAVELVTGFISTFITYRYGLGVDWMIYLTFSASMIVLVLIDLNHRILPDVITLNGIWIGLVAHLYLAPPSQISVLLFTFLGIEINNLQVLAFTASVTGAAFGGGLLWLAREAYIRLRGVEGMGLGDVKMMAMVGAFLGLPLTLLTILIGSISGSVFGLTFIRLLGKPYDYKLPFGAFLGTSALIATLYGNELINLYIQYFFT